MNNSSDMTRNYAVEVIVGVERRRRWTAEEKQALVEEAEQIGNSVSLVARMHNISASQIFPVATFDTGRRVGSGGLVKRCSAGCGNEGASNSRPIAGAAHGRKTLENEILKEAVKLAREKKTDFAKALARRGGFPMKAISDSQGVSRSNLYEQRQDKSKRQRKYADKPDNVLYLSLIFPTLTERPSYGYRRVTVFLNQGEAEGESSESIALCG